MMLIVSLRVALLGIFGAASSELSALWEQHFDIHNASSHPYKPVTSLPDILLATDDIVLLSGGYETSKGSGEPGRYSGLVLALRPMDGKFVWSKACPPNATEDPGEKSCPAYSVAASSTSIFLSFDEQAAQSVLKAFDIHTGEERWAVGTNRSDQIVVDESHGLLAHRVKRRLDGSATDIGIFIVRNAGTGEELWRSEVCKGYCEFDLTMGAGIVFLTTWDNTITAFNATVGRQLWSVNLTRPGLIDETIFHEDSGTVALLTSKGLMSTEPTKGIVSLDASTGKRQWVLNMTRPSCRFDWEGATSLIATPCGILHTYQCQVTSEEMRGLLDPTTGKEVWHTERAGQADRSAASCGQHTSMKWSSNGIVSMFVHDVATNKQLWTGELPPPYNKSKASSSDDDNSEVFPVQLYSPRGAPPVVASRQWATFRDARWVKREDLASFQPATLLV